MTSLGPYHVPAERRRASFEVKRSVFISTADRTATAEEARALIAEIRAEFPEAVHHPYAFVVGHGATVTQGASDDGEPQGTAGPPTLAVVAGSGLGDVCVVTARLYGGIKLGTGGLVRAYSGAAQAVLAEVPAQEHRQWVARVLHMPYGLLNQTMRALEVPPVRIRSRVFEDAVTLDILVDQGYADELAAILAELSGGVIVMDSPREGSPVPWRPLE